VKTPSAFTRATPLSTKLRMMVFISMPVDAAIAINSAFVSSEKRIEVGTFEKEARM
jgi:hypothetical protein